MSKNNFKWHVNGILQLAQLWTEEEGCTGREEFETNHEGPILTKTFDSFPEAMEAVCNAIGQPYDPMNMNIWPDEEGGDDLRVTMTFMIDKDWNHVDSPKDKPGENIYCLDVDVFLNKVEAVKPTRI